MKKPEDIKAEIQKLVAEYWAAVHQPAPFDPAKPKLRYSGRVYGAEEMQSLVDSALDFWLTLGPQGKKFETALQSFFGSRRFLYVNSGSSANLLAVATLCCPEVKGALKAGDEVLTPAVTFPTTLAPLLQHGLIPVFVDCEIGTYNIDPMLLEKAVSSKTRAIAIPHTLGNPCDMDAVMALAEKHDLWVFEDCCDALGSTFDGKKVGTFGDIATCSFYPAHHITTGEGGGVSINGTGLVKAAVSLRDWGRDCWCDPGVSDTCGKRFGWQLGDLPEGYDHKYIYSTIGYNLKPTDLQAAIGHVQFSRLEDFNRRRRENFARLHKALEPYQDIFSLPRRHPKADPSWFGFPITVSPGVQRREVTGWLEKHGIETRLVFAGNILKQPGYRAIPHRLAGPLTNSDRVMNDTFFLGVYPGLGPQEVDYMADVLARWARQNKSAV